MHILVGCSAYSDVREIIFQEMEKIGENARSGVIFKDMHNNPSNLTQFILDCSSLNLPARISYDDTLCSKLFELSRDLCFSVNKTRLDTLWKLKQVEKE